MTIKALVPIRLNSKRIPLKNIKEINGKSLVEWTIKTLNEVKEIDEIIVYCSDEIIKKYIISNYTLILRDPILDGDDKNIHDILHYLIEIDNIHSDYWIIQQCTSPFIKPETIRDVIDNVLYKGYDSAFTVVEHRKHGWFNNKELNFNIRNIGFTQTANPIYTETSGPYMFKEKHFLDTNSRVSDNHYMKIVPFMEGIDIDNKEDLELAEIIGKEFYD